MFKIRDSPRQLGHFLGSIIWSTIQVPLTLHEALTMVFLPENHIPLTQAYDRGLEPYVSGARLPNNGMALGKVGGGPQ
jgi:hypothetical protein